jgi:hypothetical protein
MAGKAGRMVNMAQKLCTNVCRCKNDTCRNHSRNGGWAGVKDMGQGGEFNNDIFDTL